METKVCEKWCGEIRTHAKHGWMCGRGLKCFQTEEGVLPCLCQSGCVRNPNGSLHPAKADGELTRAKFLQACEDIAAGRKVECRYVATGGTWVDMNDFDAFSPKDISRGAWDFRLKPEPAPAPVSRARELAGEVGLRPEGVYPAHEVREFIVCHGERLVREVLERVKWKFYSNVQYTGEEILTGLKAAEREYLGEGRNG